MSQFFCKKKAIKINSGKAYNVCLLMGCPYLMTARSDQHIKKLKKKYRKNETSQNKKI